MFKITDLHLLMLISITLYFNHGYTFRSGLFLTNDCACPGNNLIFECTVIGGAGGATQWKGDALDLHSCSVPVFLRHRDFITGTTQPMVCNGGAIVIRSLRVESNRYTSQMNISFSSTLINRTVDCAYDNGTLAVEVGSISIGTTKRSYPPPMGIHLISANPDQLTFAWNLVAQECSDFHYNIFAQNCGDCPSRTHHDIASCSDYSVSTQTVTCSFALQTVFCEDTIGIMGNPVEIILKVPKPPFVDTIIYRYLHLRGNTIGFIVQFNAVSSFAISDEIEGSALSYTLSYSDSLSGISCGSATVPASSYCVDGVCQYSFSYEGSPCSPLTGVNVTISVANILGSGPSSYPFTVQDQPNTFISVIFELATNSIVCNFQIRITHGSNYKLCRIDYGPEEEGCSSYSQTSHSTSDMVRIGLPLQLSPTVQYCFTVTGNNSIHTAIVEGTFTPDHVNITQVSCAVPLGLSLTFVILISSGIIIILVVINLLLARAYKKIQVQLMKVQTVKAPVPAIRKPNTNRIYEELDGDLPHTDVVLSVKNVAYATRKDFHRNRCVTPCSDSGETEDAYYCTI